MRIGLLSAGWVAGALAATLIGCSTGEPSQPPDADRAAEAVEPVAAPAAGDAPPAATVVTRGPGEEEIARLRAAYDQNPENEENARLLAIALFDSGRTTEALAIFEAHAADSPTPGNLLNLGRAYAQVSRYPEAAQAFERVLAVSPENPLALHGLGNLAVRRGDPETAIAYYNRAIAARPGYVLARFHLADALKETGRYREAYETFASVLDQTPENQQEVEAYDDALYEMAALDITMGAPARAAEMLEELLRANPEHRSAWYAYGQALLQLGRAGEAQTAFQKHMEVLARLRPTGPAAMGE